MNNNLMSSSEFLNLNNADLDPEQASAIQA